MRQVVVEPGSCGCSTRITAEQMNGQVRLEFDTDCPLVHRYAQGIGEINVLTRGWSQRVRQAEPCHESCLVPIATLKVIEVEVGANLPRNATIRFVDG